MLQTQLIDKLERGAAQIPPGATIYAFGHPVQVSAGIPVFGQSWDLDAAAKLRLEDQDVVAYPIRPTATVRCRPGTIAIHDFRFGKAQPRPYERLVFLDARTGRLERIATPAECAVAARALGAPVRRN